MKNLIIILCAMVLFGCASTSVTLSFQDLDWNPPDISNKNCPNLTGKYISPKPLLYDEIFPKPTISGGLFENNKIYERDKELVVFVTIYSRPDGVLMRADNGRNHVEMFTPYDGVKFGCHGNMLVSRFIGGRTGGAESGRCTGILYGEYRTYLSADGHALVVRDIRDRCLSLSRPLMDRPPVREAHSIPTVFLRADN